MIHINLLNNVKNEQRSEIPGLLATKPVQYVASCALGFGLLCGITLQQYSSANILSKLAHYNAQRLQETIQSYNLGEQEKDSKEFFTLNTPSNNDYSFSLAAAQEKSFSLQAFKPTPVKELCQKKQSNERPAVLDTIDAKIGEYVLVVNKQAQTAQLYKLDYVPVSTTPISTGRNEGDKEKEGDNKTPGGIFKVVSLEDSSKWTYEGELAYGPKFLRLNYSLNGQLSIGIHGTNESEKLGAPASHGCVRMNNDVISWYVEDGYLKPGTKVAIVENNNDVPSSPYTTFSSGLAQLSASAVNYSHDYPENYPDELEDLVNYSIKKAKRTNYIDYTNNYQIVDEQDRIPYDAQKVIDRLDQFMPEHAFEYKQPSNSVKKTEQKKQVSAKAGNENKAGNGKEKTKKKQGE